MTKASLLARAEQLRSARRPFVFATVVRAERPTSAKPGDCALVHPDGTIEGFVGGSCAESSLRVQALQALDLNQPTLLLITPELPEVVSESPPGIVTVANKCLSGGTIEIFLEPSIPDPLVFVYGHAPIAEALLDLGQHLKFDVRPADLNTEFPVDLFAVILATHGSDEAEVIKLALDHGVGYIGLIASRKRGRAVLDLIGIEGEELEQIHTPAGLDIGAREPEEVAVSIFAELISTRRSELPSPRKALVDSAGVSAVDLVCKMEVAQVDSSIHLEYKGNTYWFCGSGCLEAFKFEPDRYLSNIS